MTRHNSQKYGTDRGDFFPYLVVTGDILANFSALKGWLLYSDTPGKREYFTEDGLRNFSAKGQDQQRGEGAGLHHWRRGGELLPMGVSSV